MTFGLMARSPHNLFPKINERVKRGGVRRASLGDSSQDSVGARRGTGCKGGGEKERSDSGARVCSLHKLELRVVQDRHGFPGAPRR